MANDVSPYIEFRDMGFLRPGAKTRVWYVINKRNPDDIPGIIKWNGGWRKYVYYSGEAFYDWQCLRQIADFIEQKTKDHRSKNNVL